MARKSYRFRPVDIPVDLYRFQWDVPKSGFSWEEKEFSQYLSKTVRTMPLSFLKKQWYLVMNPFEELNPYFPLEIEPTLFFKFANIRPDKDGILQFANKYGWLGDGDATLSFPGEPPQLVSDSLKIGENYNHWVKEIIQMKIFSQILEWIFNQDKKNLKWHIYWGKDCVRFCFTLSNYERVKRMEFEKINDIEDVDSINGVRMEGLEIEGLNQVSPINPFESTITFRDVIIHSSEEAKMFYSLKRGDLIQPAKILISKIVNQNLWSKASPYIIFNHEKNGFETYFQPHNLLGALWVQFHKAIIGEKKYKRCKLETCQQWMDVTDCSSRMEYHPKCKNTAKKQRSRAKKKEAKTQ